MRNREKGQSLLLVVLALGIFLLGSIGLAIDGAQLYAHREMAQAAADAAAQAGIFSIFGKTKTTTGASHTCSTTDTDIACTYARNNGFGGTTNDTVVITYPSSPYNGVTGSPNYTYPFEQVTITRTVSTTFMKMFGTSSTTVKAIGGAGIVQTTSPVPILVLDTAGAPSFSLGGNTTVIICGGPQRSIQVNSSSSSALSVGGSAYVDLSKAGPADPGNCSSGNGGDFGVVGGTAGFPTGWLTPVGSTEHYIQPSAPLNDPLASVSAPSKPAGNAVVTTTGAGTTAGSGDCPVTETKGCTIYNPGYYSGGIQVKNTGGIFQPGIYYLDGGFSNAANGDIYMCSTTCVADTSGCCANNGVMIYLSSSAGAVNISANSTATLLGSSASSSYKGILFFVARTAANQSPKLGGGGNISLTGTVYMPSQTLSFQGNSGSTTLLKGELIVDDLALGGGGSINMDLDPAYKLPVDQVALVK
jgi:hypothetical protein